ncbi:MAG: hypothetical protein OEU68_13065 [Nitrospira sp.]|jgi:hypothetical protein|nr:hypothetical protein [Nitrospira sp.]MDH4245215.1 hypothetical protein [Nitrospira sp.]MDH4355459.1 hypothetical protein [Nitrospira sp.]MDH5319283.1 hypothetical protein [Nitrospira sp.]
MSKKVKFEYGQTVSVVQAAPTTHRREHYGSVCGIRQVDGHNFYLVEFSDGLAEEFSEEFLASGE